MAAIIRNRKFVVLSLLGLSAIFLLILSYLKSVVEMPSCIFCDIINGKVPKTVIEKETDEFVIFKDIKPASTHHFLAVSKRHIESLKVLKKQDANLVANMESGLKQFFESSGINITDALFGFHLPPFISVKHLHMHGIAPRSTMGFFHSFMFRPGTAWFKTVEETQRYIQEKVQ